MKKILIINGPNLNLLGTRKPKIYGKQSLNELNEELRAFSFDFNMELTFFQSNHEGEIIDLLHKNRLSVDGVILNPGAFTHYSYALRDAIEAVEIPKIEVHMTDITKREAFRKISVVTDVCVKKYMGEGIESYKKAISYFK